MRRCDERSSLSPLQWRSVRHRLWWKWTMGLNDQGVWSLVLSRTRQPCIVANGKMFEQSRLLRFRWTTFQPVPVLGGFWCCFWL